MTSNEIGKLYEDNITGNFVTKFRGQTFMCFVKNQVRTAALNINT
jgi:hypothetical protein